MALARNIGDSDSVAAEGSSLRTFAGGAAKTASELAASARPRAKSVLLIKVL